MDIGGSHQEIAKAEAMLAIVLSERTGRLTELQRDFLVTIRGSIARLALLDRNHDGQTLVVGQSEGESWPDEAFTRET